MLLWYSVKTKPVVLIFLAFTCVRTQHDAAVELLKQYDEVMPSILHEEENALFVADTNITTFNIERRMQLSAKKSKMLRTFQNKARNIDLGDSDLDTRRQFTFLRETKISTNITVSEKVDELKEAILRIYNGAAVPNDPKFIRDSVKRANPLGDNDLNEIMATSNNPDELLYVWKSWRRSLGPSIKPLYSEYVKFNNIGARENGFADAGDFYRKKYETDDIASVAENLLTKMKPFYLELHGYVRYHLSLTYPTLVQDGKLIPAHLLGHLMAQSWEGLYPRITPYPGEPSLDISAALAKINIKPGILTITEEFFTSLGWPKLPAPFWINSMFIRPGNRKVNCLPKATDLRMKENGQPDVRMKMCMTKTAKDFTTIHHEFGHIYYYLFYWNQSLLYREGANPAFHEAVGDAIALSVQTPSHLHKIGLLQNVSQSREADINFLMKTALELVSFMPYSYAVDTWRWDVYSGRIKPREYNKKWRKYQEKYQGIVSPGKSETDDFDLASRFHVANDVPYIRYFLSFFFQFTFHKHGCKLARNAKPLHQCSIYQSKEAGKAFGKMLELGRSKPWPEVLKTFTGSEYMSHKPVTEFFYPLIRWLKEYRAVHKYKIGWDMPKENGSIQTNIKYLSFLFTTLVILFVA